MVPGVDKRPVRKEPGKDTVLLDPDPVGTLVALRILGMLDAVLPLRGDVLVKRPAKADIDDLQALTDAKYRLFLLQSGFKELHIVDIDLPHGVSLALDALLSVENGIHIRPS